MLEPRYHKFIAEFFVAETGHGDPDLLAERVADAVSTALRNLEWIVDRESDGALVSEFYVDTVVGVAPEDESTLYDMRQRWERLTDSAPSDPVAGAAMAAAVGLATPGQLLQLVEESFGAPAFGEQDE